MKFKPKFSISVSPHSLITTCHTSKQQGKKVFPDHYNKGHIIETRRFIKQVTTLSDVSFMLHDLRRTLSTIAQYEAGIDFYTVKRLLNHAQGDVTFGYIVDSCESLRPAMVKISETIQKLIA